MEGNRRQFLGSVAAISATGAFFPPALGAETPEPEPASVDWDMSWRERVRGPFRGVFDNPVVNEGAGLWRAADWKKTVAEVYRAKDKDVSAVLVIRHEAIPMIMQHAFWERHELGKDTKLNDSSGSPVTHNPYLSREETTDPGRRSATLDSFLASGGIVLACNYAFGFMVSKEIKKASIERAEARAQVLQQVIPGVILMPSGFFAVIEAQRAGCHFFPAAG
jgi:hypothetical protein